MREVTYESLVRTAVKRAVEEAGSVKEFAKMIIPKLDYIPRTGKVVEVQAVISYLSLPRTANARKGGSKNFKFLKALYKYWGINISQQQFVQKQTVITADL